MTSPRGAWLVSTYPTRYIAFMQNIYAAHEAKARFSELLRQARQGKTVTIAYRGKPVAEIRSIQRKPMTPEARFEELERRGVIVRPSGRRSLKRVGRSILPPRSLGGRGQ